MESWQAYWQGPTHDGLPYPSVVVTGTSLLREFGPGDVHKAPHGTMAVAGDTGSAVWSLNSDFQPPICGDGVDSEGTKVRFSVLYCKYF